MITITFKDFSPHKPREWEVQSELWPDVSVYYDAKQKAWCREVRNVRCTRIGENLVPEPGQLISYPKAA